MSGTGGRARTHSRRQGVDQVVGIPKKRAAAKVARKKRLPMVSKLGHRKL